MKAVRLGLILMGMGCAGVGMVAGCKRDDMADQPKVLPLRASALFADGAASRVPPAHTVSVDAPLQAETHLWQTPTMLTRFPFPITRNDLLRGQQQFAIACSPCHGLLGDGDGMIPERGFTRPPSYHTERLRGAPPSYIYNVITNGIGAMFPYSDRVQPDDRWRIAAYIRALQISQGGPLTVPATTREGRP